MAHQVVWGLDIGNSAVKAVKMIREGQTECRITDFDIVDIHGGDDDADRSARVHSALSTLVSNHEFGKDPVYISLPGNLCLFREFQLPAGSEAKLKELVQYEAKQQIPFPLEQVEMAWETYEDTMGGGIGVEMIVVRKNIVQEILSLIDQVNLNVQGISVSAVALFNFIHYEYPSKGATLILDAGAKATDFVVVHNRHMYSRTIQIAGREITRVLENKFKVPFEKAEDLKKNIGQSKQAQKILSVIEPTLRQLNSEIQRTIGFYKSKARGQKIQQAYLMGHTFRLPGMAEQLAGQIREAPFTIIEGVRRIRLDHTINPDVFSNEFPTLAVPIGLGLQGLGVCEWDANLLPPERKKEIQIGQKRVWGAISAAAIMLTVAGSYLLAQGKEKEAAELKDKIDGVLTTVNENEARIKKISQGLPQDLENLKRISAIGKDRGLIAQVYNRLLTLRDFAGKPFFGLSNLRKATLANLYVSRVPFFHERDRAFDEGETKAGLSNNRLQHLKDDAKLNTELQEKLYGPFKNAGDLPTLPEGLRPDLPLLVYLSGEAPEAWKFVEEFKAALCTLKEVRGTLKEDCRPDDLILAYLVGEQDLVEQTPVLNKEGHPDPKEDQAQRTVARKVTPFHLVFRWYPEKHPDVPIPVAVARKPGAAGAAKAKAKSGP